VLKCPATLFAADQKDSPRENNLRQREENIEKAPLCKNKQLRGEEPKKKKREET